MTATWNFKQLQPGDTVRNPISEDFFSQDAIENASEALVREAVQNSLDASFEGQPVRINLKIIDTLGRPAQQRIGGLLQGLATHLRAEGNGLLEPPDIDSCTRYGIIEDWGTTGLRGDPRQWQPVAGVRNDFFAFFRAEGYSAKEGEERGRWGVGKTVFPRSSRINTFFGLTVQRDIGVPLLMGRSILKTHIAEGAMRVPDGYFGEFESGLALPTSEIADIAKFQEAFEVTPRGATDFGLSVVVPFLDDSITTESLLRAAVRDYFHPILTGSLEVAIEGVRDSWLLDAASIRLVVRDEEAVVGQDIRPIVELAAWGLVDRPAPIGIANQQPGTAAHWSSAQSPPDAIAAGKQALASTSRQAFQVGVWIRKKSGPEVASHFDVFLADSGDHEKRRPVFVRDGIVVSNAAGNYVRGRHALVVIDHVHLAEMLGDAENVAHTEWNKDRSLFQQKYYYAKSYLGFVRAAPAEIVTLLTAEEMERDPDLLRDILSIEIPPEADLDEEEVEGGVGGRGRNTGGPGGGPPRLRRFRITRVESGFAITPGDADALPLEGLQVRMAYDLRGGNPIRAWHPADFEVDRAPIVVEPEGECRVLSLEGNNLIVAMSGSDFRVTVTGFDTKRDLFVRAQPLESAGSYDRQ